MKLIEEILLKFHEAATNPKHMMDAYIKEGRQIVLCGPPYAPEEIVYAFGAVPFGAWGSDCETAMCKEYYPAFLCGIVQSALELGLKGTFKGAKAYIVPQLCDSLKCLAENWIYAVPDIQMIQMSYPQNRKCIAGFNYVKSNYIKIIKQLETVMNKSFSEDKLREAIDIYNRHNDAMRRLAELLAVHSEITAAQRNDLFKSSFFMDKKIHTEWIELFISELEKQEGKKPEKPVFVTGILADSPKLLELLDKYRYSIVGDDLASQSRQYRIDSDSSKKPIDALAEKFCNMGNCSILYDEKKSHCDFIAAEAKRLGASGVLFVATKFCDPEEFDYPFSKKSCEDAGLVCLQIEVDRQMKSYGQAETSLETFAEML